MLYRLIYLFCLALRFKTIKLKNLQDIGGLFLLELYCCYGLLISSCIKCADAPYSNLQVGILKTIFCKRLLTLLLQATSIRFDHCIEFWSLYCKYVSSKLISTYRCLFSFIAEVGTCSKTNSRILKSISVI